MYTEFCTLNYDALNYMCIELCTLYSVIVYTVNNPGYTW